MNTFCCWENLTKVNVKNTTNFQATSQVKSDGFIKKSIGILNLAYNLTI